MSRQCDSRQLRKGYAMYNRAYTHALRLLDSTVSGIAKQPLHASSQKDLIAGTSTMLRLRLSWATVIQSCCNNFNSRRVRYLKSKNKLLRLFNYSASTTHLEFLVQCIQGLPWFLKTRDGNIQGLRYSLVLHHNPVRESNSLVIIQYNATETQGCKKLLEARRNASQETYSFACITGVSSRTDLVPQSQLSWG
jgi:hypothetical protein